MDTRYIFLYVSSFVIFFSLFILQIYIFFIARVTPHIRFKISSAFLTAFFILRTSLLFYELSNSIISCIPYFLLKCAILILVFLQRLVSFSFLFRFLLYSIYFFYIVPLATNVVAWLSVNALTTILQTSSSTPAIKVTNYVIANYRNVLTQKCFKDALCIVNINALTFKTFVEV